MKIFLDTNFLIRDYLKDDPEQFEYCKNLVLQIEEGKFRVYTSAILFLEISYVLRSVYKLPLLDVLDILDSIFSLRGITIIEKTDTKRALHFYRKYQIKFTDCLIATQVSKNMTLISFDEELSKIKDIVVKKPQQII